MKYTNFWPIFEFLTAKCSPSLPGSRDKKNPIYVAPSMNSSVKLPETAFKEKQLFKLTGEILGMERKRWHVGAVAQCPVRTGGTVGSRG